MDRPDDLFPAPPLSARPPVCDGWPPLARLLAGALDILERKDLSGEERSACGGMIATLWNLRAAEPSVVDVNGVAMMATEEGGFIPARLVKDRDRLVDEFVRRVVTGAMAISDGLGGFKGWVFSEAAALRAVLAADYSVDVGGDGGNATFTTRDRRYKVQITRQGRIAFGPELIVARSLLLGWVDQEPGSADIKALITDAFRLDGQNQVRADEVLRLRRLNIDHDLWREAMRAITDAMIVAAKKDYVRVYERQPDGGYRQIALDLANA